MGQRALSPGVLNVATYISTISSEVPTQSKGIFCEQYLFQKRPYGDQQHKSKKNASHSPHDP